ncbi:3-hydroxy-3-methylglutaryl-coenzyme A reductase [Psilocybe cubensis]|uniref:3-hydroxy-3-methylglutaryl-coenzyme A reductase n=1 Tax=Psilocybe cubensis TaxID=181762 RepID=A0ACB8GRD3_PSICU|nr:3-hydroxy-3-methylglutaryl-coenzyme A reductase [Psilocybe cubensis]KAH9477982.1 3-hydroxy-3-methylglutaryl-coenzyme A reductase [Psilocybe cubensis]
MRALFRPFALHAAYTPIETIVFFCIIGTLAYFHILSAIKHSAFIDPSLSVYAPPTLRPAYALWRLGEWVGVREGTWTHAAKALHRSDELVLELQQVVVTLDGAARRHAEAPLAASVVNMTQHLAQTFQTPAGRTYAALCHRLPAADGEGAPCFTLQQPGSRALVQTLAFRPGMRDEFVAALVGDEHQYQHQHQHYNQHQQHPRVFTDEHGVRFEVDAGRATTESVPINQMRNGKWVAYAARALVVRFWDLAKKADSLDILLILAGYILMHTTFYLLLIRSRALGSSFWLPLAILSSAVLAMLISLPIAMALRIRIDPVALTEALPFLVCTVGFDKPLRLARAVFLHPHLSVPPALVKGVVKTDAGYPILASSSNSNSNNATNTNTNTLAPPPSSSASASAGASMTLKPAPLIITESLHLVYAPIIRDYILEIAVLAVGAYSRVGGLSEVCALAALMLGVDCLLLCTYLAAILGVMVEVSS